MPFTLTIGTTTQLSVVFLLIGFIGATLSGMQIKKLNRYKQYSKGGLIMTLFTIDEVRKTFKNGEVEEEILKGINLSLNEGEITALVGASGSGKSTLLTIAAGLQPATDGQVLFEEQNLTTMKTDQVRKLRASKFGFVFQFAHLVPFLTVEEQLLLMLDVAESPLKRMNRNMKSIGYWS